MPLKDDVPDALPRRELHSAILATVSDAVIATDRDLHIVSWNEAASRMYGWTENEALGCDVDDLLQTRFVNTTQQEAQRSLGANRYWAGEIEQTTRDGHRINVDARVSLLTGSDGKVIGGVTANRDVTEDHQMRQLLEIQRDMLIRIGSASTSITAARIALEATCKLDGVECGVVYLRTTFGQENELEIVAANGIDIDDLTPISRIKLDAPFFRQIVERPTPYYENFNTILSRAGVKSDHAIALPKMRGASIIPIVSDGNVVGTMHLASCIHDEIPLLTRQFMEQLSSWLGDILAKKVYQQELEAAEQTLRNRTQALTEANTALKVVLRTQREEQNGWHVTLREQFERRLRPLVDRLKSITPDNTDGGLLDVLELEIESLVDPYRKELNPSSRFADLTPRETQVAALIRSDHSTKEIAAQLSISPDAVGFHRKRIREKLGLTGTGKNLRQFLTS